MKFRLEKGREMSSVIVLYLVTAPRAPGPLASIGQCCDRPEEEKVRIAQALAPSTADLSRDPFIHGEAPAEVVRFDHDIKHAGALVAVLRTTTHPSPVAHLLPRTA